MKVLVIDEIKNTIATFPVEFGFISFLVSGNAPNTTPPYTDVVLITKQDYDYSAVNRLRDLVGVWGLKVKFHVFTQSVITEQSFFACKTANVRIYSKTSVGTSCMYQDFKNQIETLKTECGI